MACSRQEPAPPPRKAPETKLLIGLIPERNIFKQIERYEPLAEYLFRKTGAKVSLKILPRYGNIIENFRSSGLDGAFFGSFTYALAHAKVGVEVLARPVALDNTSTYHGLIFVRKDRGIRTAGDMKGKRFAFVDKATTAGYLLPLEYFRDHGIQDYKGYLKEAYFTGTHEDAVYDVLNRKADIGAAKNTVFHRLAKEDPRIRKDLVVLARSPDVPENALALRKDLDAPMRSRLKEALLNMHMDPDGKPVLERFGALRFIETTDADYAVVVKYAEHNRLNLATYDYKND
ncbi:MAG: hypothetical protein A2X98_06845 [Deltaproteobacteria bacterium GWC2_66_88]|nr:MAG: hypothetical protein A2X98_06845 [Deltaproteobacteria bacterium GWC2_66_88]